MGSGLISVQCCLFKQAEPGLLICKYQAAKNYPCRFTEAGHRQAICDNVAEKWGDACLLFGS